MNNWVCYLIRSLDSNATYIGSSNNQPKRLNAHNDNRPQIKRKGARRTRGQTWIPVIVVSGFTDKRACLSFESGWKRLHKKRTNCRLDAINLVYDSGIVYGKNPCWNRLVDLLYFSHNSSFLDSKYRLNYDLRVPINQPPPLYLNVFLQTDLHNWPWPHYLRYRLILID